MSGILWPSAFLLRLDVVGNEDHVCLSAEAMLRDLFGRSALVVRQCGICASAAQDDVDGIQVAVRGRDVQRGLAVLILRVDERRAEHPRKLCWVIAVVIVPAQLLPVAADQVVYDREPAAPRGPV